MTKKNQQRNPLYSVQMDASRMADVQVQSILDTRSAYAQAMGNQPPSAEGIRSQLLQQALGDLRPVFEAVYRAAEAIPNTPYFVAQTCLDALNGLQLTIDMAERSAARLAYVQGYSTDDEQVSRAHIAEALQRFERDVTAVNQQLALLIKALLENEAQQVPDTQLQLALSLKQDYLAQLNGKNGLGAVKGWLVDAVARNDNLTLAILTGNLMAQAWPGVGIDRYAVLRAYVQAVIDADSPPTITGLGQPQPMMSRLKQRNAVKQVIIDQADRTFEPLARRVLALLMPSAVTHAPFN